MSKQSQVNGLIEDLRNTSGATLSREGCLILANLIEEYQRENKELKDIIARCRCEECGNEIGDNTEFSYGIYCKDCVPYELDC